MLLLLPNDTLGEILEFLSLDQKRNLGLTCSKLWHMYRTLLSKQPELKYFQEQLILIRQYETNLISMDEDDYDCDFRYPKTNKAQIGFLNLPPPIPIDRVDEYMANYALGIPNNFGHPVPASVPLDQRDQYMANCALIKPLTKEEAFEKYQAKLEQIITDTVNNKDRYNSLEIPIRIKYIINIWLKYPSKLLRLVPVDILQRYLADVQRLGLEYVMLFDLHNSPGGYRYISGKRNMWNCGEHIVTYQIYSLSFSVNAEFQLLMGMYDACEANMPLIDGKRYFVIDPEYKVHERDDWGDLEYQRVEKDQIKFGGYYTGESDVLLQNYLGWIINQFKQYGYL